jgi:hypothetical protein
VSFSNIPPDHELDRALEYFVAASNWSDPKNSDWDRLYRFTVVAFKQNIGWDKEEMQKRLLQHRMPKDIAAEFARVYEHCLLTLKTAGLVKDNDPRIARVRGEPI